MLAELKELFADFADNLFAPKCLGCHAELEKGEKHICTQCWLEMAEFDDQSLADSGAHWHANVIGKKLAGRLPLGLCTALFTFRAAGRVQQLIHTLKYKDEQRACEWIGQELGRKVAAKLAMPNAAFPPIDYIAYVPMHPKKLRKRGYNQAEWMALGAAKVLEIPIIDLIEKRIWTESQTKTRNRIGRWQNLQGAFALRGNGLLAGKHILLIDDVVTTGATIESAAQPLLAASLSTISVAVLANVD